MHVSIREISKVKIKLDYFGKKISAFLFLSILQLWLFEYQGGHTW